MYSSHLTVGMMDITTLLEIKIDTFVSRDISLRDMSSTREAEVVLVVLEVP